MRKAYTTKKTKKTKKYNKTKKTKKYNKTKKNKISQINKRKSRNHRNRATRVLKGFGPRKDRETEDQKKELLRQSIPNVAPASLFRAFAKYPLERVQEMTNDKRRKVYTDWRITESTRRNELRTNQQNTIAGPKVSDISTNLTQVPKRKTIVSQDNFNSPFKKKSKYIVSDVDKPNAMELFAVEGDVFDETSHDALASSSFGIPEQTGVIKEDIPTNVNLGKDYDEDDDDDDFLKPFDNNVIDFDNK